MSSNLCKLCNHMSSECYFPKPVKLVEIPKSDGGKRPLGIPNIEDRIAQMAVVLAITPRLKSIFHENSYGYRSSKSAHDAIAKAWERCGDHYWVLLYQTDGSPKGILQAQFKLLGVTPFDN